MQIGQAARAVGLVEPANRDLAIVRFVDGRAHHAPLRDVAHEEIGDTVYTSSGLFALGSIRPGGGRREENLREILRLPFDCDLADWLEVPKEELFAAADDELTRLLDDQQADIEEVFARVGLPIHQLDRTGYGHVAYIRIDEADQSDVPTLRRIHRWLVEGVNRIARFRLVDPQVSDAGTRITRLVPCLNTKGAIPRQSFTVYQKPGAARVADFAIEEPTPPPTRILPDHARALPDASVRAIVDAIAPHWQEGQRHWLALGLSGWFAKSGVPEDQAVAIIEAISAGDGEAWDRRRAVATTYERARSGREVRGYLSLRDSLPDAVVGTMDDQLSALRGRIIRAGAPAREPDEARPTWPPLPDACRIGLMRDYLDLASPTTEASDALLLGAWLSVLAATCGRNAQVQHPRSLYANLFITLVGSTGFSRKDHAVDLALDVVEHAMGRSAGPSRALSAWPFGMTSDISSAQGLVKDLNEIDANLLVRLREMTALLENMRRQGSTIADKCIELWDSPRETANNSKLNGVRVEAPCLNMIATTQPERLIAKMSESDVTSGFANRWLYLFGADKEPMPSPPALDLSAAADCYQTFRQHLDLVKGKTMLLTVEATERWDEWYLRTYKEAKDDPIGGPLRVRHHPMAKKIALLYAIGDGDFGIDRPHLDAAIALVDWSWSIVKQDVQGWGSSDEVQLEHRIEEVLTKRGPLKKWVLQGHCKRSRWPQTLFHRVVEAMCKNGVLVRDAEDVIALKSQTVIADEP